MNQACINKAYSRACQTPCPSNVVRTRFWLGKCDCHTKNGTQCRRHAFSLRNGHTKVCTLHYTTGVSHKDFEVRRRRWTLLRVIVKILSLHQRAVVTANHPLAKLQRGEFNCEDD